jgi:hypothetical protein
VHPKFYTTGGEDGLKMFLYEITKVTQKESFFGTKTNFTKSDPEK